MLTYLYFINSISALVPEALAAPEVTIKIPTPEAGFKEGIGGLVNTLITWAVAIGAIATLLWILLGGFNYVTAGDDAEKAEGARKTITNGVLGLIIIASAFAVFKLLVSILNLGSIFPGI